MKLLMTPFRGPTEMTAFCSAPLIPAAIGLVGGMLGGEAEDEAGAGVDETNVYGMNREAFNNPYAQAQDKELTDLQYGTMNREAAQAQAAQRSELARVLNTTIDPAAAAAGASLGPTATSATAQAGDSSFRNGQSELVNMLASQASGAGPSLAQDQLRRGMESGLQQQAALASTMGGNPALARRRLAMQGAAANRGLALDSATLRLQEMLGARQQLGSALGNAREQDNALGLANAGMANTVGLANANALNANALNRAQMAQQNQQFNAGQTNARALAQGQLTQQANMANAAAANEMYGQNLQARQQTNMSNLESENRQRALNDQTSKGYLDAKLSSREADRQANIAYETKQSTAEETARQREQNADDEDDRRTQQYIGGAMNAVGTVAGAAAGKTSDPRAKRELAPMSAPDDRRSFAQHLASVKVSDPRAKRDLTALSAALARGRY